MQASHGLEGPPEHQTDITTGEAHGNTTGNFQEGARPKAVTRGWAHWSADPTVGRLVGASTDLPLWRDASWRLPKVGSKCYMSSFGHVGAGFTLL